MRTRISYSKLLPILVLVLASATAHAGSIIDKSFDDAHKAATEATQNKNHKEAADRLDTAGTVKTVADYTGLAATTATIGAEVYDWVAVNDKKLKELEAQYQAAVAAGNSNTAASLLRQIQAIKAERQKLAKGQASTQNTLATIQTVAGAANIGAGAASFYAAYEGYGAGSDLNKGKKGDDQRSAKAIQESRDAAKTALIYGAGEMAIGAGSIFLAQKHKKNAKNLKSLSEDPDAGLGTAGTNSLYDQLAQKKCGAGAAYKLEKTSTDPEANVVCVNPTELASTSSTSSGDRPDIFCTMDAMMCSDGSFVQRDVKLNCQFKACPATSAVNPLPAPSPSSEPMRSITSGASRAPADEADSAGASRAPVSDMGSEVERDQAKILNYGY